MLMTHKDLIVWQRSMDLAEIIHRVTASFPKEEVYGITSQMRRTAYSIPSNIAEGYGRNSDAELKRFLTIASGSASELETQVIICGRVNYLNDKDVTNISNQIIEIVKMQSALISRCK